MRSWRCSPCLVGIWGAVACNEVSGVGDLRFGSTDEEPSVSSSAAVSSSSSSGAGAVGGQGSGGAGGAAGDAGTAGAGAGCAAPAFFDRGTGHCYEYIAGGAAWKDLRAACGALGGDLAALSSQREFELILGSFSEDGFWLGAHDESGDGSYVWTNGEPWGDNGWGSQAGVYPWPAGSPELGNPKCLRVHSGMFDSDNCANQNPGLCER